MPDNKSPFLKARVLNCLRAAEGSYVTPDELVDYVYQGQPPLWAMNCVMQGVQMLRKLGYPIKSNITRGYYFAPDVSKETRVWELVG